MTQDLKHEGWNRVYHITKEADGRREENGRERPDYSRLKDHRHTGLR